MRRPPIPSDADRLRLLAQECRDVAGTMQRVDLREQVLTIAKSYEDLARRAEKRSPLPIIFHTSTLPRKLSDAHLLICPTCKREMLLFGVEPDGPKRDVYTFECDKCGHVEVRGVPIR
jgi:hypothetical protein